MQAPFYDDDGNLIREVDNLTPDRIAQEAKFGQQNIEKVREQAQLDLDLMADGQVSGVQYWFFTSPEGGGASGEVYDWLEGQGIEVFVNGAPWNP